MRALILELGFATEAEMARPFDFMEVCVRFFPLLCARVEAGLPASPSQLNSPRPSRRRGNRSRPGQEHRLPGIP